MGALDEFKISELQTPEPNVPTGDKLDLPLEKVI